MTVQMDCSGDTPLLASFDAASRAGEPVYMRLTPAQCRAVALALRIAHGGPGEPDEAILREQENTRQRLRAGIREMANG